LGQRPKSLPAGSEIPSASETQEREKKQSSGLFQPVEKASNSLAFSNNLWYNIPGDEKC